jgi:hypothetical protein
MDSNQKTIIRGTSDKYRVTHGGQPSFAGNTIVLRPGTVHLHPRPSMAPTAELPVSTRPDDFTFVGGLVPTLLNAKWRMNEPDFIKRLNNAKEKPGRCTNVIFLHPTEKRSLVAIRYSLTEFVGTGEMTPRVGTSVDSSHEQHTRYGQMYEQPELQVEALDFHGNAVVRLVTPRDFKEYAQHCSLLWWQLDDQGRIHPPVDRVPFSTEGLSKEGSPEVIIPGGMIRPTVISMIYEIDLPSSQPVVAPTIVPLPLRVIDKSVVNPPQSRWTAFWRCLGRFLFGS